MKFKAPITKLAILLVLVLVAFNTPVQETTPKVKYLIEETMDNVKIDFDNDGDLDYIIAGVFPDRHQGRVYLIENRGTKYAKPEYIYSYPTIPVKQKLEVSMIEDITTIYTIGTSPGGRETKYTGTLIGGQFEGMTLPPVTSDTKS